mgnify:CR=1 FL=1
MHVFKNCRLSSIRISKIVVCFKSTNINLEIAANQHICCIFFWYNIFSFLIFGKNQLLLELMETHANNLIWKSNNDYLDHKVESCMVLYFDCNMRRQTCNSSSVRFSPSSLATRFKFLNEIFPVVSSSNNLKALSISSFESFSLIFCVISVKKSLKSMVP